ncbi:putative acid phosphatase [Smittium culicis]|uniref:Putative acid phosphatase n=2 Tax=Smittium culicis TaxID=133412 RepID=A0A1R1XZC8_9FUNG|nr:putative acid phosphatase [Smittium culicis]
MSEISPLNGVSAFPELSDRFIKENYPSKLKLVQVQLYHRHGERVPIARKFANISPLTWDFCKNANVFHEEFRKSVQRIIPNSHSSSDSPLDPNLEIHNSNKKEFWQTYREERVFPSHLPFGQRVGAGGSVSLNKAGPNDEYYNNANPSTCGWGQLSDVGWNTMRKTGEYIRNLYIDRLGFLPKSADELNNNDLLLRTTDYSRALESIHQVISGLYPIKDSSPNKHKFNVLIRTIQNETLFLNFQCKNLKEQLVKMHKTVSKMYPDETDSVKNMLYESTSIGAETRETLENTKLASPFHSVYDTLIAMRAHSVDLPSDVTPENVDRVGKLAAKQWMLSGVFNTQLGRLQFSPIGLDMLNNIVSKINNFSSPSPGTKSPDFSKPLPIENPPSFAIYSGHDTTIVPTLAALGFHLQTSKDPKNYSVIWPDFGSVVSIELFKGPAIEKSAKSNKKQANDPAKKWPSTIPDNFNADGYYVRANYNGKPLIIPKCREKNNHDPEMGPSMCTLDAFFQQLQPVVQTTHEWKKECRA